MLGFNAQHFLPVAHGALDESTYACKRTSVSFTSLSRLFFAMHVCGPRAILTLCESGGPCSVHATKQWVVLRVGPGLAEPDMALLCSKPPYRVRLCEDIPSIGKTSFPSSVHTSILHPLSTLTEACVSLLRAYITFTLITRNYTKQSSLSYITNVCK